MENYNQPFNMPSALGQQPVTFLGEVSVEPLAGVGIIEEALTQVRNNLTEFAASETFETDILIVFGESANVDLGQTIIDALAVGENLPQIIVVPVEQMNGASGGFDSLTGTVYLADTVIASETKQSPNLVNVLTEELGHYIDSQLNRIDTPGDEGEHFAALVRGEVLNWEDVGRLRREDDRVRILGGLVEVEADDSFETAIDLGVLTQDISVVDDIGGGRGTRRDQRDYYRFVLGEKNDITIALNGLLRDANLSLYDISGELFLESSNSGRANEAIEATLDAGAYYLEVSPYGSNQTGYSLNLSASELIIDPDSTPELANDIGKLTQEKPFQTTDEIGRLLGLSSRDSQDWYRFELEEESFVDITLGRLRDNADVYLYAHYIVAPITDSRESGRRNESIAESLDAGVYYLQVSPAGNDRTSYNLSLNASPAVSPVDRFDMGTLTSTRPTYSNNGRIGSTQSGVRNSTDRYSFTLPEESEVGLSLSQLSQDANLRLLDSSETFISVSSNRGSNPEEIEATLFAGDYYLEVTPQGSAQTSYQLTASVQTPETTPPEISISDTKITEGNRGRKNAQFQITLDAKPEETVRVNYTTANQTAKANQDYKPTNGTLTFSPGQTRKTITVPILGDTQIENNETFQLNLSKPKNAQLKDKRGIGTITNDDFATLSIKDTQITEGDSGKKQAKFTVALNAKVNERVEVSYATSDGTAQQGSDYQKTQGKLTFKPGETQKTITVPILGDTLDEDNETFSVTLSKPSKGVKLGDQRAIGTIKDNGDKGQADGDTLKTAIDFGKLLEKEVISNDIGATIGLDRDTDDYYRFQVSREGTLRVFLDSLFEDANVELLGSGEELISQSENDGTSAEEIIQVLDPDTYYLRVYPNSGDRTPYRLSVNFI